MGYSSCYISGAIHTLTLEHTNTFNYMLLLYHQDLTALDPVVAFILIPNELRTGAPGCTNSECAVGKLCLIMRTSDQVLWSLIWSDLIWSSAVSHYDRMIFYFPFKAKSGQIICLQKKYGNTTSKKILELFLKSHTKIPKTNSDQRGSKTTMIFTDKMWNLN